MRKLFLVLGGMAALALIAWSGVFLFWHLRITNALRKLESEAEYLPNVAGYSGPMEEVEKLQRAGCRALPYLVERSVASQRPPFLTASTLLFMEIIQDQKSVSAIREHLLFDLLITGADTPDSRQEKCDALHAWWRRHGRDYHQPWRVWTGRCGG